MKPRNRDEWNQRAMSIARKNREVIMPGDISRTYKGPKDGSVPSWMDEPSAPTLARPETVKLVKDKRTPADIEVERLEIDYNELRAAYDKVVKERDQLRAFVTWIEAWVSAPAISFSTSALDGLFGMARDRLSHLHDDRPAKTP